MKKENRKLAMEQKAAARDKEAKQQKVKKRLSSTIPNVIAVIVFVVIAAAVIITSNSARKANHEVTERVLLQTDPEFVVEDGDFLNIDFVGTIDGVEFEGGNTNGEGAVLQVGAGMYIDDFEEQLIGYHPGDVVEVTVTFPDTYQEESLRGKEAVFTVTINGIYA